MRRPRAIRRPMPLLLVWISLFAWSPVSVTQGWAQETPAPVLQQLHSDGALDGEWLRTIEDQGHVPLHIPVISGRYVPDADGLFLRHLGGGAGFPGIPPGTELTTWFEIDGLYHEGGRVIVEEGAALEHTGPMGVHTEWVYLARRAEGVEVGDLERPDGADRIWIAPSDAGMPSRREGRPPHSPNLEGEWVRVLEIRDPTVVGVPENPPDAPWIEGARHGRWLTFDGPNGVPMFAGSVTLLDSGSEFEMNHLLWIVDEEGTVWFETITNFLDGGAPPEPQVTQDLNGNGIEEVHAQSMVVHWTGERWEGVPVRP